MKPIEYKKKSFMSLNLNEELVLFASIPSEQKLLCSKLDELDEIQIRQQ